MNRHPAKSRKKAPPRLHPQHFCLILPVMDIDIDRDFDFGLALRLAQARENWKNETLASAVGVRRQQITRWRGSKMMQGEAIVKICRAMDISLNDFYALAQATPPTPSPKMRYA